MYRFSRNVFASVLSEGTGTREDITAVAVHNWIEKYMDAFLPDEFKSERTESIRLREINGAGLLDRLFAEVSNNKVFFNKVHHGFKLVEWLIKRKPDYLEELGDYLEKMKLLTSRFFSLTCGQVCRVRPEWLQGYMKS